MCYGRCANGESKGVIKGRSCYVTLPWGKFLVLQIWQIKTKEMDMHDFPVHDCAQEPNSSPYFSSIVGPRK